MPLDAIATLQQLLHQVALKIRLANRQRVLDFLDLRHRIFKMRDETRLQIVRIELFALDRAHKNDTIARA